MVLIFSHLKYSRCLYSHYFAQNDQCARLILHHLYVIARVNVFAMNRQRKIIVTNEAFVWYGSVNSYTSALHLELPRAISFKAKSWTVFGKKNYIIQDGTEFIFICEWWKLMFISNLLHQNRQQLSDIFSSNCSNYVEVFRKWIKKKNWI